MTIKEFFETKTVEELAEIIAVSTHTDGYVSNIPYYDLGKAFDMALFDDSSECPEECRYLEQGWYEDAWMDGMCECKTECPYKINRKEIFKKLFIEWLNTEI